jgi:hypothetical protein
MSVTSNIELVWGALAIGRLIGLTERQTIHLLKTGGIPARKVGGRWVAERGELARFFQSGSSDRAA